MAIARSVVQPSFGAQPENSHVRDDYSDTLLDKLKEGAPKRSATVRTLARFASNAECPTAALGFAARVDFDHLLQETKYAAPFGQSPFAFRRGNRFEERLRENGHQPILRLLHQELKYAIDKARVENLRGGGSMDARAVKTEQIVREIVSGKRTAPNLLDGAVLVRDVGGIQSHFEADAVAAQFAGPIHAGEIKSFPTVDGQADPENVGAAIAQVSIYILLLRELVDRVGGDPTSVSADALLITPKNTGLQPTLTVKNVGREIERARRILQNAPRAEDLVGRLPMDLPSFGAIASGRSTDERVDLAQTLLDRVGARYCPECLSSCGLARLCRERAERAGDPARTGPALVRLIPQITSVDRVYDLANGARPSAKEKAVADQLVRATSLIKKFGSPSPRKRPHELR